MTVEICQFYNEFYFGNTTNSNSVEYTHLQYFHWPAKPQPKYSQYQNTTHESYQH